MVRKTEHTEQVRFVYWFRKTYPDVRIFAIPNGGLRNKVTAMRLKAEGVTPGVPDLYIPEWNVWVEMKKEGGGRASAAQKDWSQYLERIGHTVGTCHGFNEAVNFITQTRKETT